MNPAQPQAQPQPLDPQVVALAQSIRQNESNNNFNQKGKSGEFGAYQWMPETWKMHAKDALGNPNAQPTPENQNAVAYATIKKWKDAGLNPAQIAAKWNSGSEVGWENKIGTNKMGVAYNVPQYVKKVTDTYQQMKGVEQVPGAPTPAPTDGGSMLAGGLFNKTASADTGIPPQHPEADTLQKLTSFFNAIFPGKQVGEAIGTLAGFGIAKAKGTDEHYDLSAPTPLQVAGDVAQGALAVGAGMPAGSATTIFGKTLPAVAPVAKTALGRIAGSSVLGAGFGLTGAVAEGETDIGAIANATKNSAIIGGLFGASTEAVSKVLQSFPKRIVEKTLKINPKTLEAKPGLIDKALDDMAFGTKATMEKHSQSLLDTYKSNIDVILKSPEFKGVTMNGKEATGMVMEKFSDSALTQAQVNKIVKQVAPEAAGLYERFITEGLNLVETNRLRSLLDSATNSVYTRNAVPPFSKKVAVEMADILRTAIQEGADETKPIFEKYTRELAIHNALKRVAKEPSFKITMKDLIVGALAHGAGLPALGTMVAQEVIQNPAVKLNAAKAASKAAPVVQGAFQAAKTPVMTATSR